MAWSSQNFSVPSSELVAVGEAASGQDPEDHGAFEQVFVCTTLVVLAALMTKRTPWTLERLRRMPLSGWLTMSTLIDS